MKTPYAFLLVKPSDPDEAIRKAYWVVAQVHHPDRNGGVAGELWAPATAAYDAIKTDEARARWAAKQHLLAGTCTVCGGCGVVGTRMFKGKIRLCAECGGNGRI
jgi:DnaJ-class molecular chaperone